MSRETGNAEKPAAPSTALLSSQQADETPTKSVDASNKESKQDAATESANHEASNRKKGAKVKGRAKKEILRLASIVNRDGWLGETIYDPKKNPSLRFAWSLRRSRSIGTSYKLDGSQSWLKPPADPYDLVGHGVVLLPSDKAAYGTQKQLVEEIKRFIHGYTDVPAFWEDLLAHYVLLTWVHDRFGSLPYLRFLGEAGEGKTRLLNTIGHLSYRPILLSGAMTAPAAFRLIETWRGTLVIDEADFRNSDMWAEIIKVLNAGYKNGGCAVRCEGKNFEPRAFNVFGPKVIANRARFMDSALEERCLTVEMEERPLRNDIPRQLLPDSPFFAQALAIRNKLLQWRFNCFDEIKVDESQLKHLPPRLAEIATPIWSVSDDPGFRERLLAFLRESEVERRAGDPKALVVEAVQNIVQDRVMDSCSADDTFLTVKAVTDKANELGIAQGVIEEKEPLKPRRVGAIVRSLRLAKGKPTRSNKGYRFQPDEGRLEELGAKYLPTEEEKT